MDYLKQLMETFTERLQDNRFIQLTLSKPRTKKEGIKKITIKLILLKQVPHLSFVYRYQTKDVTKNYQIPAGTSLVEELLSKQFYIANLFTSKEDLNLEIYPNGKQRMKKKSPSMTEVPTRTHDRLKNHLIKKASYLIELGVTDTKGKILKSKGDKFKQINKFVEIIANLFEQNTQLKKEKTIKVVDMGAGKGYLTFAVYDFLTNTLNIPANVLGVEIRPDLVHKGNQIADKIGFKGLQFEAGYISDYDLPPTHLLIALHACDTATDDAIYKGIQSKANIIICAPCCHKQIRRQIKKSVHIQPILEYGILKERQAEMVTDVIRALLLEANGYKTKVFEFISTEHTGKNVMIIGEKRSNKVQAEIYLTKIQQLKEEFGIDYHYLERLLI